jgi:hypothetical protein
VVELLEGEEDEDDDAALDTHRWVVVVFLFSCCYSWALLLTCPFVVSGCRAWVPLELMCQSRYPWRGVVMIFLLAPCLHRSLQFGLGVLVWRERRPSKWILIRLFDSVFPFSCSSFYYWVSSSSCRSSCSPSTNPQSASSQSIGVPLRTES